MAAQNIEKEYAKVAARADRVIYLADGEICDRCVLGKYKKETGVTEKRKQHLSEWLKAKGFLRQRIKQQGVIECQSIRNLRGMYLRMYLE